jgi:hypothetical protein
MGIGRDKVLEQHSQNNPYHLFASSLSLNKHHLLKFQNSCMDFTRSGQLGGI